MARTSKQAAQIRNLSEMGYTRNEISEILCIPGRSIQEAESRGDWFRDTAVRKIKYIGLRNWMIANRISIIKLERLCGMARLQYSLIEGGNPRKQTIDLILRVTGLTYEECFREDPKEESGDA